MHALGNTRWHRRRLILAHRISPHALQVHLAPRLARGQRPRLRGALLRHAPARAAAPLEQRELRGQRSRALRVQAATAAAAAAAAAADARFAPSACVVVVALQRRVLVAY